MKLEPIYQEIGARIQAARKRQGLTQTELGERFVPPVPRLTVTCWELGRSRIPVHRLVQVAILLNVTPKTLLGSP